MIFIDEILTDIEWRITQLVTIRTLPIKYNLSTSDREIHNRTSIPAIYALWEGFVKEAFSIYARYLDSLQLSRDEPYRVCRRVNILRDYADDKIKIYP